MKKAAIWFIISCAMLSCNWEVEEKNEAKESIVITEDTVQTTATELKPLISIQEKSHPVIANFNPHQLVEFAKTLSGTVYKYASTNPAEGFDCSGFITYVFNHFNIAVPRSSVDFTNVGETINVVSAKEGDLILFTGTVDSIRIVGHMGIVTENIDTLKFIHSSSGKANGVTITPLNEHYQKRFVKIVRVFKENK